MVSGITRFNLQQFHFLFTSEEIIPLICAEKKAGKQFTISLFPLVVPRGRAMAVLCPMHGEGAACPMMYKTLNVGQSKLFRFNF